MNIRAIPRPEFERLLPHYFPLESLMGKEVEWFSSRSGNLLGTIAKHEGVAGWNYAVLKGNENGDFRVRKVMNNFFGLNAARVDLLLSMAEIEKVDYANREATIFGLPSIPAELFALNYDREHGQQSDPPS